MTEKALAALVDEANARWTLPRRHGDPSVSAACCRAIHRAGAVASQHRGEAFACVRSSSWII